MVLLNLNDAVVRIFDVFPSLAGDEVVRTDVLTRFNFDDLLFLQRLWVDANNLTFVHEFVEIVFDCRSRDVKTAVKFQISMNGGRRECEVVFRKKAEKFPLSLGFRHTGTVGGLVCISSEPTSLTTIRPTFRLVGHIYPNKGKLLSSWPRYTRVDHELGVRKCLFGAKKPTGHLLPAGAQLMAKNRMAIFEPHRLKLMGGMTAAQTPSSASAPDQLRALVGANALSATATNQRPQTQGGGRHVGV